MTDAPSLPSAFVLPDTRAVRRQVEAAAASAEPNVAVESVRADVTFDERGWIVEATYRLRATGPLSGRPVAFDRRAFPFLPLGHRAPAGVTAEGADAPGPVATFRIPPEALAEGVELGMTLLWPAAPEDAPLTLPWALAVPAHLPALLGQAPPPPEGRDLPRVRTSADEPSGMMPAALRLPGKDGTGQPPLVQSVLVPDDLDQEFPLDGGGKLRMASGAVGSLTVGECERIGRLASRLSGALAKLFQQRILGELALLPPWWLNGTRAWPAGAALVVRDTSFGIVERAGEPLYWSAAHALAGAWWGGGLRIAGPLGAELMEAHRAATALRVMARFAEEEETEAHIAYLRDCAEAGAWRDRWARAKGIRRPALVPRMAVALWEALERPAVAEALPALVRLGWGKELPDAAVLDFWRARGVALDGPRADG